MSTRPPFAQRLQRGIVVAASHVPGPLLRLATRPPRNSDGARMAPDVALLMAITAAGDDYSDMTPTEARRSTEAEAALLGDRVRPCRTEEELDLGDGLAATRFSDGRRDGSLILFFHGGGFALGSRASYTAPARMLAQGTGADVVSVEYRLAPEHPFPACHEDAIAAWRYVVDHAARWGVDPYRIAVAGESAGGNVAAVLCQAVRGDDVVPALQVLIQPVTDISVRRPSQDEFADSPALSAKQVDWFMQHYLPDGTDHHDPRVSPLLAPTLADLPPAIVAVAGFDPLRDDGLAYATALLENGVPTRVVDEPDNVHGYISFTALSPTSKAATRRLVEAVGRALTDIGSAPRPTTEVDA